MSVPTTPSQHVRLLRNGSAEAPRLGESETVAGAHAGQEVPRAPPAVDGLGTVADRNELGLRLPLDDRGYAQGQHPLRRTMRIRPSTTYAEDGTMPVVGGDQLVDGGGPRVLGLGGGAGQA